MPFLPHPRQPWGGGGVGSKAIPGARTPWPSLRAGLVELLSLEPEHQPDSCAPAMSLKTGFEDLPAARRARNGEA